MGFRRLGCIALILIFFPFSWVEKCSVFFNLTAFLHSSAKIFFTSLPSILLAYWGVRRERKRYSENIIREKEKDIKILELGWYNKIILEKLIDPIIIYYALIENNLSELAKINNIESFEEEINYDLIEKIKLTEIDLRQKLDILKIFDETFHKQTLKNLMDTRDNWTSEIEFKNKRKKNIELKIYILKKLYEKAKKF